MGAVDEANFRGGRVYPRLGVRRPARWSDGLATRVEHLSAADADASSQEAQAAGFRMAADKHADDERREVDHGGQ